MGSLSLEALKKLNRDSTRLNKQLEDINTLFDECYASAEGMTDITQRIAKMFKLYKELVSEMRALEH